MSLRKLFLAVLQAHTDSVTSNFKRVLEHVPSNATEIEIVISPYQDGDGGFLVFVALGGPDLYVLNERIREFMDIFLPYGTHLKGFNRRFQ